MHQLPIKLVSHLIKNLGDKHFRKLLGTWGREIEIHWKLKNFKIGLRIRPRIVFTYSIIKEKCVQDSI